MARMPSLAKMPSDLAKRHRNGHRRCWVQVLNSFESCNCRLVVKEEEEAWEDGVVTDRMQ
uniref:HDC10701 n=1 Tax=Drosophila melanogaster TaxID=7227 RepID=Q6IL19_DROME|nr:TPA_inf: HDC10701 [Drosophila melanogaster]